MVTMRIENSKIWVNGVLIPEKDLPKSLRNLSPDVFYQTAVFGIQGIAFTIGANDYLLRDGKISVLKRPKENRKTSNYVDLKAKEDYYSQLKRESPGLFYSLSREGALIEQVRGLIYQYQTSEGKQQKKIREEIRLLFGQLFDINEHNQELEIKQLEQMLDAARKEVEFRKENKEKIISKTLNDLVR